MCQTTPNATDGSGHVSPGGLGTDAPVFAAIISPTGSVSLVYCGGLNRSKAVGPPHRVTTPRAEQRAGTLSGGEQHMVALGRALMSRPTLLMLDEPSLGIAPKYAHAMFDVLAELRAGGTTMLLVEQNLHAALRLADRAYVLQTGTIATSVPAAELAESHDVRRSYLGL